MKEEIIFQKKLQKELLDLMNTKLLGIQIWLPEEDSIIPSELGGYLYVFNMSIIGKSHGHRKLEIHINKYGRLLLQLLDNDNVTQSPYWYDFFNDIKDFKEKLIKVKEMLKAA